MVRTETPNGYRQIRPIAKMYERYSITPSFNYATYILTEGKGQFADQTTLSIRMLPCQAGTGNIAALSQK